MQFKTCKLFDKTFEKYRSNKSVPQKFKEFIRTKSDDPHAKFGSSDYAFTKTSNMPGYWHAKLTFDISLVYKIVGDVCYLYGLFSHDDLGTGQPANIAKQKSNREKFDNAF